ncbi:hypothetical protein HHI36_005078, partial [Cryptolaemus montrouzieri]
ESFETSTSRDEMHEHSSIQESSLKRQLEEGTSKPTPNNSQLGLREQRPRETDTRHILIQEKHGLHSKLSN